MKREKRRILKNITYTLNANVISTVISLVSFAIFPKILSPTDYSYWQLFTFYATYAAYLSLGITDGAYLRYGGQELDELPARRIASQFWALVVLNVVVTVGALALYPVLNLEQARYFSLIMALLSALFVVPRSLLTLLFQATGKLKQNAIAVILDRVAFIVLALLFLLIGQKSYHGMILAGFIGRAIPLFYAIAVAPKLVLSKPAGGRAFARELKANVVAGLPLLLANLASHSIIGVVRFIVDRKWGVETFGVVSLSLTSSNLFLLLMTAVGTVLYPLLRRRSDESNRALYRPMHTLLTTVLMILLVFYHPVRRILTAWLPQYEASFYYLGLLFPMIVFECRNNLLNYTYLKSMRKERFLFIANAATLALSAGLAALFAYQAENVFFTLAVIPVSIFFKTMLLEAVIRRRYAFKRTLLLILEPLLLLGFIVTALNLPTLRGFLAYLGLLAVYLLVTGRYQLKQLRALLDIMRA